MASNDEAAVLAQPFTLPFSGKTVRTRFLKSAMTERLCSYSETDLDKRGKVSDAYLQLYHEWGVGGFGVIVLGNIPVHREHLEAPGNLVIDKDLPWNVAEELKPVVKASKADGALLIGQLTAGGRQVPSHVNKNPLSPSGGPAFDAIGMHFNESKALTKEQILDFIERWAYAAKVLYDAGADGCQLHAAHGYLLSQFLSPEHNTRDDEFGGSFEKRARIVFDIIKAIRKQVPDEKFIISIKINSQDFSDGGWSADDCKQMVKLLEDARVDLIELSGGSYQSLAFEHKRESTKKREGFFVEFADQIRPAMKKAALVVTGGFRTAGPMAKAVREKSCDIIGLARPVCGEPRLPALIVSGQTVGTDVNLIPSQLQTPAAVQQIHEIGETRPISDLTDQATADRLTDAIKNGKFPEAKGDYPPS